MLWGAASGRCSFPNCPKRLVSEATTDDPRVMLGEMAHIIGESVDGPRGESPLTQEERDSYENLILLCHEHHELVDGQPKTYTVEVVHAYKRAHEGRCASPFGALALSDSAPAWTPVEETLHSTLLQVVQMPRRVYSAEAVIDDEFVLKAEFSEANQRRPPAFIIRGQRLLAFDDLADAAGTFSRWVRPTTTTTLAAIEMWRDPDRFRWYVSLLNTIVRKLAGSRGLTLDKAHHRFYFTGGPNAEDIEKSFTPMNRARSTRNVAWRPTVKATGDRKKYWEHLAIGLQFVRVADNSWVFGLRPERHFTIDGQMAPLTPKGKGRRSTSRAARLYNGNVLNDLQFWRSYLSEDKPQIVFRAGAQSLVIDTRLAATSITWPGITNDHMPFANQEPEEDLFSRAELLAALDDDSYGEADLDV
jgi:hypothetical protein